MSNIRPEVRSIIKNVLEAQDGYHSKVDVLRVIEEEAILMKETQYTVDMLDSDPMEQFSRVKPQIEHLKRTLQVKSCSRVRVTNNYCKIDAVIGFEKSDNLQLTFRYERKRRLGEDGRTTKAGFHIRYSIEMSINHQQRENIVVVEVWTDNNWPSIQKAVCVNEMMQGAANDGDDEEGGWEDIKEGETGEVAVVEVPTTKNSEESSQTNAKRPRLNDDSQEETSENGNDNDDEGDEPDSYLAHLDPEVLHEFLELAGIKSKRDEMQEDTAFFLLMTFPFYEQEWDLVGFVLEEMFGDGEDEE